MCIFTYVWIETYLPNKSTLNWTEMSGVEAAFVADADYCVLTKESLQHSVFRVLLWAKRGSSWEDYQPMTAVMLLQVFLRISCEYFYCLSHAALSPRNYSFFNSSNILSLLLSLAIPTRNFKSFSSCSMLCCNVIQHLSQWIQPSDRPCKMQCKEKAENDSVLGHAKTVITLMSLLMRWWFMN